MLLKEKTVLIPALHRLAREASYAIIEVYHTDFKSEKKQDNSPVTDADKRANDIIVAGLRRLTPGIAIVSEEGEQPDIPEGDPFWLVDPLDGTRSFIAKDGQFTVNIALIVNCSAVLGIIQLPVSGQLYWGGEGLGAWRLNPSDAEPLAIATRAPNLADGYDIVVSKSYHSPKMDAWVGHYPVRNRVQAGSSLKFCRVAEAAADIYPRLGRTMEWDTAAGQAIVEGAGGVVTDLSGGVLSYGKRDYLNPAFAAAGRPLPGLPDNSGSATMAD